MPVLDGRRESCSSKTNSSNCLLYKQAVTAVCLCTAVSMPVLDGRRESCSSKQTAVTAYLKSVTFAFHTKANGAQQVSKLMLFAFV